MRELIEKPKPNGIPFSKADTYFHELFSKFRKKHKEFDDFLLGLKRLIESEKAKYCHNIVKLIKGDFCIDWIYASDSLFAMLIKLYNYGLSAEQAFDYIKKCHSLYEKLKLIEYKLFFECSVYKQKASLDCKVRNFVEVKLLPKGISSLNFEVSFSDLVDVSTIDKNRYWPDVVIKAKSDDAHVEDALMLFEYYQTRELFEKILNTAIDGLIKAGVIVKTKETKDWYGVRYEYDFLKPVGRHYIFDVDEDD